MPLFEGAKPIANSRSNSRLSVSQVFSPAEAFVHADDLPGLFEYSYGGPGKVVLSKGTIVALRETAQKDYETGRFVFPVTYAGEERNPIGVLQFNVYQKVNDRFTGNMPNLLTHEYIELPLIEGIANVYDLTGLTGATDAEKFAALPLADTPTRMKMKWGCFYTDSVSNIKGGDFLVSDKFGKFIKLDLATAAVKDLARIVGQVLAIENVDGTAPLGWLKWVTPVVEDGERAMDDNRDAAPSATIDGPGYAYDPNYKYETTADYRAPGPWKQYDGIPGLTDGVTSGLGAGILPGWDFAGSKGAIRVALRY
jgi:hypothetical protein